MTNNNKNTRHLTAPLYSSPARVSSDDSKVKLGLPSNLFAFPFFGGNRAGDQIGQRGDKVW